MKRFIALLLLWCAGLSLVGCGNTLEPSQPPADVSVPAIQTEAPMSDPNPVPVPDPGPDLAATPIPSASIAPVPSGSAAPTQPPENTTVPEISLTPERTAPPPAPSPSPSAALPYSAQSADTVLTVSGDGVDRAYYFTLAELTALREGYVEADYFSRGKEPQEMTSHFKGIRISYLLSSVIGVSNAKKVKFLASDGYASSYGISAIGASYIDETDPDKTLAMILAWEEDGAACGLRLVMGQTIEGEYNRTNWVRNVIEIEVSAA